MSRVCAMETGSDETLNSVNFRIFTNSKYRNFYTKFVALASFLDFMLYRTLL